MSAWDRNQEEWLVMAEIWIEVRCYCLIDKMMSIPCLLERENSIISNYEEIIFILKEVRFNSVSQMFM